MVVERKEVLRTRASTLLPGQPGRAPCVGSLPDPRGAGLDWMG